MNKQKITQEIIKFLFYYKEGRLIRRTTDKPVGAVQKKGDSCRVKTVINGSVYMVHRLIWIYFNGEDNVPNQINHIDNNGLNNKIENLEPRNKTKKRRKQKRHKYNHPIKNTYFVDITPTKNK